MSFEHAPISKVAIVVYASSTLLTSLFDMDVYFNLQASLLRTQPYRLLTHTLYASSTPTLLPLLVLLSSLGPPLERRFGPRKFLSLLLLLWLLGPAGVVGGLAYIHSALIPRAYTFRVFGIALGDGWTRWVLLAWLGRGVLPGLVCGAIWVSDVGGVKSFRISDKMAQSVVQVAGRTGGVRRARAALGVRADSQT
ncbi:hypothetical protein CPB85DRAFT_1436120 [Mucidula mucida]|nr:hypothetical protein CPB85DRAFT_1436120 [Mucidula mucida]